VSDSLTALIAGLADNKYFLGRRYAEWCTAAPTLESAVAAAAMAQDELGHARALYPLLRVLTPTAGAENEPETRTRFMHMAVLDQPLPGWEDVITTNFLVDGALTTVFEAAVDSAYEPLAGRSRKVLQEERMHAQHAASWVRLLAREGGGIRAAFEASLRRAWPEVLCWFGLAGDEGDGGDTLAANHVLDATPDELRARFLVSIGPLIESERLNLLLRRAGDDTWELTELLPWDRFDTETHRLAHGTAAGAVVTASASGSAAKRA
jgi:ring-1,2-phenylacetyl-CoA epoxidase subunit PaaC